MDLQSPICRLIVWDVSRKNLFSLVVPLVSLTSHFPLIALLTLLVFSHISQSVSLTFLSSFLSLPVPLASLTFSLYLLTFHHKNYFFSLIPNTQDYKIKYIFMLSLKKFRNTELCTHFHLYSMGSKNREKDKQQLFTRGTQLRIWRNCWIFR